MNRYYLQKLDDGSFNFIIQLDRQQAEFGLDFFSGGKNSDAYQQLVGYLSRQNQKLKIRSVRVFVSGLLVAIIPFHASTLAMAQTGEVENIAESVLLVAEDAMRSNTKFHMTYLYGGTTAQQIAQVEKAGAVQTVSPAYFDINAQGSLVLNGVSSTLISEMHRKGIEVVPMLSNHWDRSAGEKALQDPEKLANQIVSAIEQYDLDGVNVDIENVTASYRDAYTKLVRLLREKLPAQKEVSVAVAANPNGWTTGWHGSYDYAALAKYADYLMVMAYDESWEGSDPGPVASIDFVERSLAYALKHAPADKIVLGVPFYGRIWSADGRFNGNGIGIKTLEKMLSDYGATITYSDTHQSPKAEFTVKAGDPVYTVNGKQLIPGTYTVWFEDERSLESKTELIHQYDIKGMGSWTLTQASDGVLGQLSGWLQSEQEAELTGEVTASSLRIRSKPTTSSTTIGYLSQKEQVSIVGVQDGWYRIALDDGKFGYVSAEYIRILDPSETLQTGYATGDRVRVRSAPSMNAEILTHVNKGDSFTITGKLKDGWYPVKLSGGITGYISADYVTLEAPAINRTGYATGDRVRVRSTPSTSAAILTHVNKGDSFTVTGQVKNGWYPIKLSGGITGYLSADYVTFEAPATTRTGYATADRVRVRSAPSTSAAIRTHVNKGDSFTVTGRLKDGWYPVKLSGGITGYISGDYVRF
jgi:spore germination protein YaaH